MNKWILLLLFPIMAQATTLPDAVNKLNSAVTNLEGTTGDLSGDVTGLLDKYLMTNGGKCPLLVVGVGSGSSLPISFIPGPQPIAGLQADVIVGPGLTITSIVEGPATQSAGKTIQSAPVPGGQRFLLFGLNQNILGTGEIATVNFDVTGASAGPHIIALVNFVAANADAIGVPLCVTTGVITK